MAVDRDWGLDPAVRSTRTLFRLMEEGQRQLLDHAGISPFDERLRRWRAQAFRVFESSWQDAARTGRPWTAEEASREYVNGFARVLASAGVAVPGREAAS